MSKKKNRQTALDQNRLPALWSEIAVRFEPGFHYMVLLHCTLRVFVETTSANQSRKTRG
jgi:hypothetical protein